MTITRSTPTRLRRSPSTISRAAASGSRRRLPARSTSASIFPGIGAPGGVGEAEGSVSYIAPVVDQATGSARAGVVLSNPTGMGRPGLFGNVTVLTPVAARVVVPSEAIHRLDGATVVFVVDHDR